MDGLARKQNQGIHKMSRDEGNVGEGLELREDISYRNLEGRLSHIAQPFRGAEGYDARFSRSLDNAPWLNFEQDRERLEPLSDEETERIVEIEEEVVGRNRAHSYESSTQGVPPGHLLPWNRHSLIKGGTTEGGYESDYGRHDYQFVEAGEPNIRRSLSRIRRETPVKFGRRSSLFSSSRDPARIPSTPQFIVSTMVSKNTLETIQKYESDADDTKFLAWATSQIDDPCDFLCEFPRSRPNCERTASHNSFES